MKIKMLGHKSCACYIFVATWTISVALAVTTESQIVNLQSSSTDGLDESLLSTTTSPVATTVSEFSSRQGVNGFKPSFDYARFAEQRSSSNVNSSKIKFTAGEEVRNKKHIPRDKLPPAVLKLYDSHRDQYNSSSTDQVAKGESLPKHPTIYYGDISNSNSKQNPVHDAQQINNVEVDLKEPHHHHHHENHNYEGGKTGIEIHPKYYFPKNLLDKDGPQESPVDHGHGHHNEHPAEHGHGHHEHPLDDSKVHYGHSHGYGYGYPEFHEHDHHHDDHGHHHHHSQSYGHGHSAKHTDHYKGHGLEGAIGKAFHLLIPSALFLGGVSALFPNRVHVPTTETKYRQKRAISYQAGSSDPTDFEDIPAKYLKREHRSDDGGIELDLDEFPFPNIRPPLSPSGGRNGHRNYNNARLTPHQRFELSPPTTQRTPLSGLRHRPHPSGQHNRGIPEQYDAFFFNNPGSYNFDIAPPTYSPDNEPSPIPPTFPTNHLQPTEEMVSEEELAPPPQGKTTTTTTTTTTTRKPKTKKSQTRNNVRPGGGHFVPLPIEEPVLDIIPNTTTETDAEEPETTTKSPIVNARKSSSDNSTNTRDARIQTDHEIINPLQTLNMLSPNEISDTDEKAKKKEVDLSPDGPVIGLLSSYAQHDKDSPECQKKALCQLAMKGATPVATKFESFLWNLANLVPDQFSQLYDLEEIFNSIKKKNCKVFACDNPHLDIQE